MRDLEERGHGVPRTRRHSGADQAAWAEEQDEHQDDAVDPEAVLAEAAQQLRQQRQHDGADEGAVDRPMPPT